jgi:hypothetical protein
MDALGITDKVTVPRAAVGGAIAVDFAIRHLALPRVPIRHPRLQQARPS